ncbi:hypothetical protein Y032_0204g1876 [Ancylostoma ceylanicum]|uniref:Uncharacterized protein n=1 Tax=Ancylostoma ceylanicum TaxID=53326 RepID=A0A016SLV1_9BILA|nr:hypothetical protein Y032_0204g1876 [Ancylostoma ceylanicum]
MIALGSLYQLAGITPRILSNQLQEVLVLRITLPSRLCRSHLTPSSNVANHLLSPTGTNSAMPQNESKPRSYSSVSEEICELTDRDSQVWDGYGMLPASFDPNHPKYRCCCGHVHATTGVQIIVALLSITVLFDMWQVIGGLAASPRLDRYDMVTVAVRFAIGAGITGTILVSLLTERAALLIPYLLLQGAGLAAGMVFFVSFLYISLFGDRSTAVSFLRSHGHAIDSPEDVQLNYVSWLMVVSFAIIILLQVWLMSIVIACWRYMRDKRAFGKSIEEFEVPSRPASKTAVRATRSVDHIDASKQKRDTVRTSSTGLDYV